MPLSVQREYHFESAHFLPLVHDGHKCKRMHGHNYKMDVEILRMGTALDKVGFVMDFWDMDKVVEPIIKLVDHRVLNEIDGLENPTAEFIAQWFASKIKTELLALDASIKLKKVIIWETPTCCAIYTPFG